MAYVLLVILSKTHSYKLISRLINKFLSYLHPELVYSNINHPLSYIFHQKILSQYIFEHDIPFYEGKYDYLITDQKSEELMSYYTDNNIPTLSGKLIDINNIIKVKFLKIDETISGSNITETNIELDNLLKLISDVEEKRGLGKSLHKEAFTGIDYLGNSVKFNSYVI
jgi:hypothetical protein